MSEPATVAVIAAIKSWLWAPLGIAAGFLASHIWRRHWRTHEDIGTRLAQIEQCKAERSEVANLATDLKAHMSEQSGLVEARLEALTARIDAVLATVRGTN